MKVWLALAGFVVGIGIGVAGGFALDDPNQQRTAQPPDAAPVPAACLEAVSAARDRLLLNPDVTQTLQDYRALGEQIGDEVSDLRVPNLRETLSEINDLNDRSQALIDRSVNSRFSAAAGECEQIAAERSGSPSPAP